MAHWVKVEGTEIPITDGPSKFDLMLGLFEGKDLTFTTPKGKRGARLSAVQREDGSNESWNIEGVSADRTHFGMYYSTRRRQGVVWAVELHR